MKEQLRLLLELQEIDSRVYELRAEVAALPEKLATAKTDLAKLEAILQVEKERLAESEAWRKEQEALIQTEDEAIRKAKGKLQGTKSTKEYTAASRELENKRKSKSDREEELLKVMEVLEKSRAQMNDHENDIRALREHIQAEDEKIQKIVAELEAEVRERSVGRDDIVAKIQVSLLKRYERTIEKRGKAVVEVVNGTCTGCYMSIPPQLNNELARSDSIESCPRCHRLLYRTDIPEEADKEE